MDTLLPFFYEFNDDLFLVSNWHVLSGRNRFTGQAINQNNCVPDEISTFLPTMAIGGHSGPFSIKILENNSPVWLQHPLGQEIDLACIKISSLPSSAAKNLPISNNTQGLWRGVGADCFIVGYPISPTAPNYFPIWKRATIATEFNIPFDGQKKFLVDSATYSGMSGSPVFLRQAGAVLYENGELGINIGAASTEFVGIFSGRLRDEQNAPTQLGEVWKQSLIDEMVRGGVTGDYKLITST